MTGWGKKMKKVLLAGVSLAVFGLTDGTLTAVDDDFSNLQYGGITSAPSTATVVGNSFTGSGQGVELFPRL